MFDTSQLLASTGSGGFYSHPIDQSLRFNDDDSAYLSWTPASAGNRKTWTWSGWVKRGNLGTHQDFFIAGSNVTGQLSAQASFNSSNGITLYGTVSGSAADYYLITTQVFRDVSAWYHVILSVDTTQATSSNRVKLYVNGAQVTSFSTSTYPSQNYDTAVSNNVLHTIGRFTTSSANYFDGYMAEVNFIDGQALDPTSFGEFKSGVWVPKAYSGSYGTNGFYLDFDGTYYNDKSGNGNNWTANNLAATDVVLDSPTNNFATINPLSKNPDRGNLSEGNLKLVGTDTNWAGYISSIGASSGKWYAEFTFTGSGGTDINVGVQSEAGVFYMDDTDHYLGKQSVNYGYFANGNKVNNASQSAYGSTFTNGDVMGVALDMDAGSVYFYKNGTIQNSGTAAFTGLSGTHFIGMSTYKTGYANFGQDSSFAGNKTAQGNTDDNGYGDFYYAPPTGYLALCTANLEVPDAMNPALDASPQDHFNTVLYSGNSTDRTISGVGFQPDFVWTKIRNTVYSNNWTHQFYDAVRGFGNLKSLRSDDTDAEGGLGNDYGYIGSATTDGFTIAKSGSGSYDYALNNASGGSYAAWNWKANGSGVSNTDGSITSTVSANTDAGFSIVSYTGVGAGSAANEITVGHGLTSAPEMVIVKERSGTGDWWAFTTVIDGTNDYLYLNLTNAAGNSGNNVPTSSVISLGGNLNTNTDTYIAYCFHSVEGFSKCSSYTGNGSADGTFVYTGFRPAFVMVKGSSHASNWNILDAKRDPYNKQYNRLRANLSSAEEGAVHLGTVYEISWDAVSNGFKLRGGSSTNDVNQTSETYIYMAFAENPFKYANAR